MHQFNIKKLLGMVGCLILLTQSMVYAQDIDTSVLMPPGYALPTEPNPIPDPNNYQAIDRVGLSFHGPDLLVHRLLLDNTPLSWADDLLTLIVGFPGEDQGWRPCSRYQVHPSGAPGQSADPRAMALLGDELVIFIAPLRGQPPQPYKSVNQIGYTIALSGHEIVVTKEHDRKWYFQTNDFGATWHLTRMELLARPDQFVSLVYTNNLLTALDLPNGRKFEFTYEQDRISAIHDPFGSETQIKYDRQGYISQIDQYVSDAPDGRARFRTATYSYTYDPQGRIATFSDARRVQWTCSYLHEETANKRSKVQRQDTTQITNEEGDYLFQRTETRRDGRFTRIVGSGNRRIRLDDALESYRFNTQMATPWEMKSIRGVRSKTRTKSSGTKNKDSDKGASSNDEQNEIKSGLAPWLNDAWPRSLDDYLYTMLYLTWESHGESKKMQKNDSPSSPQYQRDANGHIVKTHWEKRVLSANSQNDSPKPDAPMTIQYTYTSKGELTTATLDDQKRPHQFVTDLWGRLIKHEMPDGRYMQWIFDDLGRLTQRVVAVPLPKDPKDLFAETQFQKASTRFTYDQFGRLLRKQTDDQPEERFIYNSQGQLTTYMANGPSTLIRYRYDRLGGLIRRDQANGDRDEFAYFTDGRIAQLEIRPKTDRWVIREFNPQGYLITETIESLGKTQYAYDDHGRQTHIVHPNGKDTLYTYDDLNRIITIRGSAQPPANIAYDKDGKRMVTTP